MLSFGNNIKFFYILLFVLLAIIANAETEKIQFSISAGFYDKPQKIRIETCFKGEIHYTLDGSEPTINSSKYHKPLNLSKTKVIKVAVFDKKGNFLTTKTSTFFIGERNFSLPVVSLSSDSIGLFSDTSGIYVKGTRGLPGRCAPRPVNWNQNWTRKASFEYFVDKKQVLCQDIDLKIHGGCSRRRNQKSFRITAKKDYGNKHLNYPFFDTKKIEKYKQVILRNGGNDGNNSNLYHGGCMFRDALIHEICREKIGIECMAYQPVVVFLNGKYWGMYNLRERICSDYIEENFGIDDKLVTINMGSTPGSDIVDKIDNSYSEFLQNLKTINLSDNNNFDYINQTIDVDNFIDYCVLQLYIYNRDWSGNNVKYWKAPNQRWRWLLYDTDCGFGCYNDSYNINTLNTFKKWPDEKFPSFILYKLLENENFRHQFVERYKYHIENSFQPEYINHKIDSIKNLIEGEIAYSKQRWATDSLKSKDLQYFRDKWENDIEYMRDWVNHRPEAAMFHLKNYFDLKKVIISTENPNITEIIVNGESHQLPYTTYFFENEEIKLSAPMANNKWAIVNWSNEIDTEILQYKITKDDIIIVVGE